MYVSNSCLRWATKELLSYKTAGQRTMREDTSYSSFSVDDYTETSSSFTDFKKITDGAYCTLWRACRNGQCYVVKALRAQYASSPEYQALLKKEYAILSMFDSPYIVKACGHKSALSYYTERSPSYERGFQAVPTAHRHLYPRHSHSRYRQ